VKVNSGGVEKREREEKRKRKTRKGERERDFFSSRARENKTKQKRLISPQPLLRFIAAPLSHLRDAAVRRLFLFLFLSFLVSSKC